MDNIKNIGQVGVSKTFSNVVDGFTTILNTGFTVRGSSFDSLSNILQGQGYQPIILNNELTVIDSTGATFAEQVNLSFETGLIGIPRRKYDEKVVNKRKIKTPGVVFQALIQPKLQIGRRVNIESKYVDGVYTIQRLTMKGASLDGNFIVEAFAT